MAQEFLVPCSENIKDENSSLCSTNDKDTPFREKKYGDNAFVEDILWDLSAKEAVANPLNSSKLESIVYCLYG